MGGFNPVGFLTQLTESATASSQGPVAGIFNGLLNGVGGYTLGTSTTVTIHAQAYYNQFAYSIRVHPGGFVAYGYEPPEILTPPPAAPPVDREAARAKARELLFEFLSPEQRAAWERYGFFEVRGSQGGRYEIHRQRGGATNPRGAPVYRLRDGDGPRHAFAYCIHTYEVPPEDETLGFKLLLEANEGEFLSTANATAINR